MLQGDPLCSAIVSEPFALDEVAAQIAETGNLCSSHLFHRKLLHIPSELYGLFWDAKKRRYITALARAGGQPATPLQLAIATQKVEATLLLLRAGALYDEPAKVVAEAHGWGLLVPALQRQAAAESKGHQLSHRLEVKTKEANDLRRQLAAANAALESTRAWAAQVDAEAAELRAELDRIAAASAVAAQRSSIWIAKTPFVLPSARLLDTAVTVQPCGINGMSGENCEKGVSVDPMPDWSKCLNLVYCDSLSSRAMRGHLDNLASSDHQSQSSVYQLLDQTANDALTARWLIAPQRSHTPGSQPTVSQNSGSIIPKPPNRPNTPACRSSSFSGPSQNVRAGVKLTPMPPPTSGNFDSQSCGPVARATTPQPAAPQTHPARKESLANVLVQHGALRNAGDGLAVDLSHECELKVHVLHESSQLKMEIEDILPLPECADRMKHLSAALEARHAESGKAGGLNAVRELGDFILQTNAALLESQLSSSRFAESCTALVTLLDHMQSVDGIEPSLRVPLEQKRALEAELTDEVSRWKQLDSDGTGTAAAAEASIVKQLWCQRRMLDVLREAISAAEDHRRAWRRHGAVEDACKRSSSIGETTEQYHRELSKHCHDDAIAINRRLEVLTIEADEAERLMRLVVEEGLSSLRTNDAERAAAWLSAQSAAQKLEALQAERADTVRQLIDVHLTHQRRQALSALLRSMAQDHLELLSQLQTNASIAHVKHNSLQSVLLRAYAQVQSWIEHHDADVATRTHDLHWNLYECYRSWVLQHGEYVYKKEVLCSDMEARIAEERELQRCAIERLDDLADEHAQVAGMLESHRVRIVTTVLPQLLAERRASAPLFDGEGCSATFLRAAGINFAHPEEELLERLERLGAQAKVAQLNRTQDRARALQEALLRTPQFLPEEDRQRIRSEQKRLVDDVEQWNSNQQPTHIRADGSAVYAGAGDRGRPNSVTADTAAPDVLR